MSPLHCWKCQKIVSEEPIKIGFRAVCIHCGVDLHVCKNCRYYSLGKPNDCLIPGTDFIKDREASNLCEEFKPTTFLQAKEPSEQAKRLFKDSDLEKKPTFKDLFKD